MSNFFGVAAIPVITLILSAAALVNERLIKRNLKANRRPYATFRNDYVGITGIRRDPRAVRDSTPETPTHP